MTDSPDVASPPGRSPPPAFLPCRRWRAARPSRASSSSAAARPAPRWRSTSPRTSQGAIDVTLVEPLEAFTTCFHSNLYLGGFQTSSRSPIPTSWPSYGVKHVRQMATAIDRDKKRGEARRRQARSATTGWWWRRASTSSSSSVPGYSRGGSRDHAARLEARARRRSCSRSSSMRLQDGATIVMLAPPNPYRCPPGPYERVSCMAHVLKAKGHTSRASSSSTRRRSFSKMAVFQEGWQKHYPGMIEWMDPKMHGGRQGRSIPRR